MLQSSKKYFIKTLANAVFAERERESKFYQLLCFSIAIRKKLCYKKTNIFNLQKTNLSIFQLLLGYLLLWNIRSLQNANIYNKF